MSVDSIGVDLDHVLSLAQWLESEEAQTAQRQLEERITNLLFSYDPSSTDFQKMVAQLAWLGSRPEQKPFLEREIIAFSLNRGYSAELCKSKKTASKVETFFADHAVEIGVGLLLCATGIGIAAATGYTLSWAVGGVVVAGAGSVFLAEEKPNPYQPPVPLPDPKACSKEDLAFLQQSPTVVLPKIDLPSSTNEVLVTSTGVWANGQFFSTDTMVKHSMFSSVLQNTTSLAQMNDWKSFYFYQSKLFETNENIPFQVRGETALALGNYHQAVFDLGKAIEANPTDSLSYLERGAAHLALGEYERSLEDYEQFASQTEETAPSSVSEFCLGFAKGVPRGTYESGEGMLLFLVDFVKHPVQTSKQTVEAVSMLIDLARKDEWGTITEALSPEMHQLVTQWDTLSSEQRGELAGYAVGKHGADILLPGALAKVASKSAKSAQELASICKNLQIAQETLLLETAAGMGNGAKVSEVIHAGQRTARVADELGFTAHEMGQLKQAGKLEKTVSQTFEGISKNPIARESFELFDKAQEFLKPYKDFMPESRARELIHQTGIRTFPRPAGIPDNFRIEISKKGAGMKYVHPNDEHTYIRIMPGKPHSPFQHQQKPYVNQMREGNAVDKFGNIVKADSPEAHIPYEEFIYRD